MVVIGEREAAGGVVQATDGRDGSKHQLAAEDLANRMNRAHASRIDLEW